MARAREGLVELVAVVRPCPVHANVCALVREVMRLCSRLVGGACCVGLVA